MQNAQGRGGGKRIGDLQGVPRHLAALQTLAFHDGAQRLALRQFHGDEVDAIGFGDLMHQGNVGVVQSGDRHRVVLEFLHPLRIRGDCQVQRLEDDLLGGLVVAGLVQNPGGVLSKPGLDRVVGDRPAYQRIGFVRGCFRVLNHG